MLDSKLNRRRFISNTAFTLAATQLGLLGVACAKSKDSKSINTTNNELAVPSSFDSLKQVDAGTLNIGYAKEGPAGGPAVILLHGWPYDILSFADVTPLLTSKG